MTTPNKLSLKKKQRRGPIAPVGECIVITDSDDEKENNDKIGVAGSFRTKYRTPRRDSTILAGNLTMLDQSTAMVEPEQQGNITVRRSKGKVGRGSKRDSAELTPLPRPAMPRLSMASVMTEDLTIPHIKPAEDKFVSPKSSVGGAGGLVTEDESDFYSCQGSPPDSMNAGLQNTWMTDVSTKSKIESKREKPVPVLLVQPPPAPCLSTPGQAFGQVKTPLGGSIFKKPQGSIVKAATFFSVEKRRTVFAELATNAILAGGSDSDSSPEKKIQPARLLFTGQLERTVVASSDDQLTEDEDPFDPVVAGGDNGARPRLVSDSDDDVPLVQLGRDFLSNTQFGKIVDWVQDSPFSSKLELSRTISPHTSHSPTVSDQEVESLLKSDPEDGEVRPSWAAPLPDNSLQKTSSFSERTSKAGGSWNTTGTSAQQSEGTSKAGGSWNKISTIMTESVGLGSEGTSKAGGSWNQTGTDGQSTMGMSERTSKAGGSWNQTGTNGQSTMGMSEGTSKAGGSWNKSNRVGTIKDGDIQWTIKPGANERSDLERIPRTCNVDDERTYKGSDRDDGNLTSKAGDKRHQSKIGVKEELLNDQYVGDVGKVQNNTGDADLDGTLDDFDKLRLGGRGSGGLGTSGSWETPSDVGMEKDVKGTSKSIAKGKNRNSSTNNQSTKTSKCPTETSKTSTLGTGGTKTSQVTSSGKAGTKTNKVSSSGSIGNKPRKVASTSNKTKSATESSLHLQLSFSQFDEVETVPTKKSLNLDGANLNSLSCSIPSQPTPPPINGSILQSSYVKGPPTLSKPKLPPIENSVNAVRSWTQVPQQEPKLLSDDVRDVWGQISLNSGGEPHSQVSEGVEKCNVEGKKKAASESESEEDLNKFLVNLKSKKKPSKLISSDESDDNFVVPDDEIDSDQFATPKLSLKDRIQRRMKPDVSSHRKPRIPSPSTSDTDSDSLPDIDSRGSSTNNELHRDIKKKNKKELRIRPGRCVKKANVIYSDSEDDEEATPVHTISSDDDNDQSFVNIYEPGSYHLVPPPSTPIVIPPTEKKSKPKPKKSKVPVGDTVSKTPQAKAVYQDNNFSNPTLTFLSSLTMDTPLARCHPSALPYLKNFNKQKTELASRLYTLYNTQCFEGALPEDMEITWNVRLTKTAGLCYSRRHRNRHNIEVRSSRIELSTKVLDSGDRLRDTLIHEMCHAASWIISGYRDGHGPLWRTWAEKAMGRFPELPVIDRCHSYQIRTKYTYTCEKCGYSIGRHSKSLDTEKKVCGHCYGRFQLVVNGKTVQAKMVDNGNTAGPSAAKPKAPNAFALFVKDNYKVYKQPGVTHGDVMKMLSSKFSATKISK